MLNFRSKPLKTFWLLAVVLIRPHSFLLLNEGIVFDVAIVNYNTRVQSAQRVLFAQALCSTPMGSNVLSTLSHSNLPTLSTMQDRFDMIFEQIITKYHYTTLLTAHHLNDRLEWFLMQLGRGSGLVEMLGMREFEPKQHYTLVRPLLCKQSFSTLFS